MELTWRWFGYKDSISLQQLRQIGVQGIVTALHDVPNGEVWKYDQIKEICDCIEAEGMHWSVVESLPVCEEIKYAGPRRDELIANYKESLRNLAKAGVKTVCYNFMPVIDWVRTDLMHRTSDGSYSLYYDKVKFAFFDIYILCREGAEEDYSPEVRDAARKMNIDATQEERNALVDTIIVKTQGFVNGNISDADDNPVVKFRNLLKLYDGVSRDDLRENLRYFMSAIMPVCDECGIDMCIHPDDPPFQLLGLPRIVTSAEDIRKILASVDNVHNGLTFCAGSLSAGVQNDLPKMAEEFASRTHFVHLRSTEVFPNGDFTEASHLGGRACIPQLVEIFERLRPSVPMRVDHGRLMCGDLEGHYNPGYSFLGRMLALGQVEGMIAMNNYKAD